MGLFVLLIIIGHIIADYPLQFNRINEAKKQGVKGILIHISIHLATYTFIIVVSLIMGIIEWRFAIVIVIALVIILHFLLDFSKEWLTKKIEHNLPDENNKSVFNSILYLLDQFAHLVSIICISMFVFNEHYNVINKFMQLVTSNKDLSIDINTKITLTIIIVLANNYVSGYLVSIILKPFKPLNIVEENIIETTFVPDNHSNNNFKNYKDFKILTNEQQVEKFKVKANTVLTSKKITFIKDSPSKAGMWIGILERSIILILSLTSNIGSIGFLIAMKALTRFKQFDDKSFAEFYLVGTMLSIILGVLAGYLVKGIW